MLHRGLSGHLDGDGEPVMTWLELFAIIGVVATILVLAVTLFRWLGWWR
jgi:hypothetical protein